MRVHIYKLPGRRFSLLFLPAPGKGKTPVLVDQVERKDVRSTVGREVPRMRGDDTPQLPT